MANPLSGMNDQPGQSYSIGSRLTCAKCGISPTIIRCTGGVNGEPISIDVTCHGSKESRTLNKSDLVFQQMFFETDV